MKNLIIYSISFNGNYRVGKMAGKLSLANNKNPWTGRFCFFRNAIG